MERGLYRRSITERHGLSRGFMSPLVLASRVTGHPRQERVVLARIARHIADSAGDPLWPLTTTFCSSHAG